MIENRGITEKFVSKNETESLIKDSANKSIKNILRIIEATFDYEKGCTDPKYISIRKTVLDSLNSFVRDVNDILDRNFGSD